MVLPLNAPASKEPIEIRIKRKAQELGFAECGVSSALVPSYHDRYRDWLANGNAGEMSYLHRQEPKRGDLNEVLSGVRSVVVVAMNYYTGDVETSEGAGVVARYSRFDDYHQTMWSRLAQLTKFIEEERPGCHAKAYCDTGPVTERDLAMRAGIGWIGKHTNLIGRRLGNWFFIGELILDFDMDSDEPATTHCGTCRRCLPACPTGAITAPYNLDARRCISYLTIELKGSIPVALRPLIGNRIYGCDDCLAVCPWNKFAVKSRDQAVQPRKDLISPDLCELLGIDDLEFKNRFANSPILRTKRRCFLRNVCVALGNVGGKEALPYLTKALTDHEPLIREHAEWAIGEITRRQETDNQCI